MGVERVSVGLGFLGLSESKRFWFRVEGSGCLGLTDCSVFVLLSAFVHV